jgi:hypothetical protein
MSDEAKHSPEPWRLDGENDIADATGAVVVHTEWEQHGYINVETRLEWPWWSYPGNRARIVACVNACAGIPTEALEAGNLGEALGLAAWAADSDALRNEDEEKGDAMSVALHALGRLGPTP